jgi:hypothetical protein
VCVCVCVRARVRERERERERERSMSLEVLVAFRWWPSLAETCKGFVLLLKTFLRLMEFSPYFTCMLQSATAEDNVYHKDNIILCTKTLNFTELFVIRWAEDGETLRVFTEGWQLSNAIIVWDRGKFMDRWKDFKDGWLVLLMLPVLAGRRLWRVLRLRSKEINLSVTTEKPAMMKLHHKWVPVIERRGVLVQG